MRYLNIILILVIGTFVSCFEPFEDSIYEDSDPLIVIEANINDAISTQEIIISKSVKPDESIEASYVNNAIIQLNDNDGTTVFFQPMGSGQYFAMHYKAIPEKEYFLNVIIDNVNYQAKEIMPKEPVIDSLGVDFKKSYIEGSGYYLTLHMKKRKDTISYYKVDVSLNDSLFKDYTDLLVFNDSYTLDRFEILLPYAFEIDDTVMIDVYGISNNMYDYYYGLNKQTTNLFSNIQPPMFNPPSNISNNALGYFQAASVVQLIEIIEEDPNLK